MNGDENENLHVSHCDELNSTSSSSSTTTTHLRALSSALSPLSPSSVNSPPSSHLPPLQQLDSFTTVFASSASTPLDVVSDLQGYGDLSEHKENSASHLKLLSSAYKDDDDELAVDVNKNQNVVEQYEPVTPGKFIAMMKNGTVEAASRKTFLSRDNFSSQESTGHLLDSAPNSSSANKTLESSDLERHNMGKQKLQFCNTIVTTTEEGGISVSPKRFKLDDDVESRRREGDKVETSIAKCETKETKEIVDKDESVGDKDKAVEKSETSESTENDKKEAEPVRQETKETKETKEVEKKSREVDEKTAEKIENETNVDEDIDVEVDVENVENELPSPPPTDSATATSTTPDDSKTSETTADSSETSDPLGPPDTNSTTTSTTASENGSLDIQKELRLEVANSQLEANSEECKHELVSKEECKHELVKEELGNEMHVENEEKEEISKESSTEPTSTTTELSEEIPMEQDWTLFPGIKLLLT